MKLNKLTIVVAVALIAFSCKNQTEKKLPLKTNLDSLSYALGITFSDQATNMRKQVSKNFETEINRDLFIQGFKNGYDSIDIQIDSKKANMFISDFFKKKQEAVLEKNFGEHKKKNEAFLTENKTKENVKTTESGLQYIVLKEGTGATPKDGQMIKIHYKGENIEGKEFDSSYKRKQPYEANVNQFVKGFTEGLKLMNKGAKYKLFIPQELAYGAQQRGELIKPFSTLVFEVELLDIK